MKNPLKMNIKGIGTDIVEIKKLRWAYTRRGQALLNKIFTKKEKEYCLKYKDPLPHFTARFAVKEAIVKAFGTGFGKDISFKDIEMLNTSNGKPEINLSDNLKQKFNNPNILISISHCESYAIAFCIIQ